MVKYSGAVPLGASVKTFRETGRTVVKKGGKEIPYKDYVKSKNKKEKSSKVLTNLGKVLEKKIPNKKVLKTNQPTLTLKEREVPSVLNDPNRFFKQEMEEVKRTMFFK